MTALSSIALVTLGCMLGAYGAILLKKGADKLKFSLRLILENTSLIFGFLLYGLGTVLYILALREGELSILYPLVSITYVFIAILSQIILKEKMNRYKWIGIMLILIGVSLIGMGKQ